MRNKSTRNIDQWEKAGRCLFVAVFGLSLLPGAPVRGGADDAVEEHLAFPTGDDRRFALFPGVSTIPISQIPSGRRRPSGGTVFPHRAVRTGLPERAIGHRGVLQAYGKVVGDGVVDRYMT